MLVKFEQNRMGQTTRNFELFDKNKTKQNKTKNKTKQNKTKNKTKNRTKQNKKQNNPPKKNTVFYNHLWQRVDAILEDVSVAESLFNARLLI